MLSVALRELERIGVVGREQFNKIPPHVEYVPAESGMALLPGFYEFAKWRSMTRLGDPLCSLRRGHPPDQRRQSGTGAARQTGGSSFSDPAGCFRPVRLLPHPN